MSMSASGDPSDGMINKGFLVLNAQAALPVGGRGRTFIVTGQQRSGTSLVASILRQVGIFMGSEINDNVHEDEAMARTLATRDRAQLRRTIRERDATYGTWGFKFPMLCDVLTPAEIALFTNPYIIVPFRDSVSVAVRRTLSEYQQPLPALRAAVDALATMVAFIDKLQCPILLLSYEKSLVFSGDLIDAIMRFCDLPRVDALRERLIGLIEPNRKAYIDAARRQYSGIIERMSDGYLLGWSRLTASADPVALDLSADDQLVLAFKADLFRQDLLDAGYGTGHHGFRLDLRGLNLRPDSVIRIRVATHGVELENSGQRLTSYGGLA
jgi:hypothetical protein